MSLFFAKVFRSVGPSWIESTKEIENPLDRRSPQWRSTTVVTRNPLNIKILQRAFSVLTEQTTGRDQSGLIHFTSSVASLLGREASKINRNPSDPRVVGPASLDQRVDVVLHDNVEFFAGSRSHKVSSTVGRMLALHSTLSNLMSANAIMQDYIPLAREIAIDSTSSRASTRAPISIGEANNRNVFKIKEVRVKNYINLISILADTLFSLDKLMRLPSPEASLGSPDAAATQTPKRSERTEEIITQTKEDLKDIFEKFFEVLGFNPQDIFKQGISRSILESGKENKDLRSKMQLLTTGLLRTQSGTEFITSVKGSRYFDNELILAEFLDKAFRA